MDESILGGVVEDQIKDQGVSAIRTKDGTVFTFPLAVLEKMTEHARVMGLVTVLVKHPEGV